MKNFLVQFGISSDPDMKAMWREQGPIDDDPSLGKKFERWETRYKIQCEITARVEV